jgi:murein DD-endopeptidase MepM/ murein hydrolase activator NlpD
MIKLITPPRTVDRHGSGAWQAARGYGKHHGIDYAALPDSTVLSTTVGTVTKLGYMYNDDLSYRYVRVVTPLGFTIRYCYVNPTVKVGDEVSVDQPIGVVQDIATRYEGITPHIHVDIMQDGKYINPETYFGER